ncbi:claudin k [Tachysurus ichikawai]
MLRNTLHCVEAVSDENTLGPCRLPLARSLTVLSILFCTLALALGVLGIKCTKCVGQPSLEARLARMSGILFAFAGFLYLVPVCWTAAQA